MITNKERIGNPTSSNIWKLCTSNRKGDFFGKPGLTYIQEKAIERRLGRSLDTEKHSHAIAWGNAIEEYLYQNVLGLDYKIISKETMEHPDYKFWVGSADLYKVDREGIKKLIAEIKSYYPKNFAMYSDCLLKKDIELFKKEFPQEYWQIVSNAVIHDVDFGEAIVYMPYESEMEDIQTYIYNYDFIDDDTVLNEEWKYRFIYETNYKELPCLPDGGYYQNINKFAFIVPQDDKDFLTERVLLAESELKKLL